MTQKRLIKYIRALISASLLLLLYFLIESTDLTEVKSEQPPVFYSNQCQDNLEKLFVEAISHAQHSILLYIYSLSDRRFIHTLNQKAAEGVEVLVLYDTKTPSAGFDQLSDSIHLQPLKISGLMHKKILITDQEYVWIGSANLTTESLKLHDNLVIGMHNPELAKSIYNQHPYCCHRCKDQVIEYWSFPQKGKEGLQRLIHLLDEAQHSLKIAMYTWTHPLLTQAILRAYARGVSVQIILDRDQAFAVGRQALENLKQASIDVRLSSGPGLLHHKFVWIDDEILVNGSANWTKAAFTRNSDCFLIIHPLTYEQNEKMQELWYRTYTLAKPYKLAAINMFLFKATCLTNKKHFSILW